MTEIIMVGGGRYRVEGSVEQTEGLIIDAARGSIMQLAWLTEAETGERLGVNPEHVVVVRSISS